MGRPSTKPRTPFGERIAAARTTAGLTQRELAAKIAVTQRVIAYWERDAVSLKADQLDTLAKALNVTTDSLVGRRSSSQRGAGPVGKTRRVFEEVSKLPRHQQQKIVDTVETLIAGQKNKMK